MKTFFICLFTCLFKNEVKVGQIQSFKIPHFCENLATFVFRKVENLFKTVCFSEMLKDKTPKANLSTLLLLPRSSFPSSSMILRARLCSKKLILNHHLRLTSIYPTSISIDLNTNLHEVGHYFFHIKIQPAEIFTRLLSSKILKWARLNLALLGLKSILE